ncbi:MAG: glycosyltransferase family protein [Thermonemataceae bacterium]
MAKFLFIVQGEGRGHMTQAISLQNLLKQAGHELVAVLVGKSPNREIPDFFFEQIEAPIETFGSPNFVTDKQKKAIRIFPTITYNLKHARKFLGSLRDMHQKIQQYQPDLIINFYDFLGGLYKWRFKSPIPMVCIGHQYFLDHPEFTFPEGKLDQFLLKTNSKITAYKATKKLALSFQKYLDDFGNTVIVPPKLRKIVQAQVPEVQDFILVYVNNDGYGDEIMKWHEQHRSVRLHCFWDRKGAPEEDSSMHPNLTFHQINAPKFLEKMRTCKGFVTTAGFESVCEAMYLGKPVMMVPVEGHFEQHCNALDGQKAGAGIMSKTFDLSKLLAYIPQHQPIQDKMQDWVQQAPAIFIQTLEACLPAEQDVKV